MKAKVAFVLVSMATTLWACGCSGCLPKIPCCWAGVLVDLLGLAGVLAPTA